ncbi:hypothetical protein SNOG_03166 [Parastagonospora nodorum SN15]|uniref:Uncharacterized protein n=1 Tax=Phaeosphaeria nodorum (strain SN15 / ATCC MYA-4574 / FGSC 10173) TaxID=321614 RepID=Q0UYJ8_PHANO|nr:hypothetical protein SNOG_03166 [Parastagonospora nodorum SN15]EAT89897.1 hypothetical protein SNOG_03166 [Parastagonospora nodorum SN15]
MSQVDYISHHPIIIQDPKLGRLKVHSYSKRNKKSIMHQLRNYKGR